MAVSSRASVGSYLVVELASQAALCLLGTELLLKVTSEVVQLDGTKYCSCYLLKKDGKYYLRHCTVAIVQKTKCGNLLESTARKSLLPLGC